MNENDEKTREYIIDMLAELCVLAQQNQQEDIYPLLSLSYRAITNLEFETKTVASQR